MSSIKKSQVNAEDYNGGKFNSSLIRGHNQVYEPIVEQPNLSKLHLLYDVDSSDSDDWFTQGRNCKVDKNGVPLRSNTQSKAEPDSQETKTKSQNQASNGGQKERNNELENKMNVQNHQKTHSLQRKDHPYFDQDLSIDEFMDIITEKLENHEGVITLKIFTDYALPKYRKATFGEHSRFRIVEKLMISN
jgi:hypothetical protein